MPLRLPILSPGRKHSHNAGPVDVSLQMLQEMAESFDPASPVRLVAGHPAAEQEPEFELGRLAAVAVEGEILLSTNVAGLAPATIAAVRSGQMNRVSAKLRPPTHPENATGKWRLMHVGLFGRTPTADAALPDVEFSADGDIYLTEFNPKQDGLSDAGGTAPPVATATHVPDPNPGVPPMDPTSDRDAELAAQQAELEQKEIELAAKVAAFERRQEIQPFLGGLVAQRKLHPSAVAPWSEVFAGLAPQQEIEFAQGDETVKEPTAVFLKRHLSNLPELYPGGEAAPAADAELAGDEQPASTEDKVRAAAKAKYTAARKR